jgi:hypothetical protein
MRENTRAFGRSMRPDTLEKVIFRVSDVMLRVGEFFLEVNEIHCAARIRGCYSSPIGSMHVHPFGGDGYPLRALNAMISRSRFEETRFCFISTCATRPSLCLMVICINSTWRQVGRNIVPAAILRSALAATQWKNATWRSMEIGGRSLSLPTPRLSVSFRPRLRVVTIRTCVVSSSATLNEYWP